MCIKKNCGKQERNEILYSDKKKKKKMVGTHIGNNSAATIRLLVKRIIFKKKKKVHHCYVACDLNLCLGLKAGGDDCNVTSGCNGTGC